MKVWISKYAQTDGIQEAECEISGSLAVDMTTPYARYFHGEGRDWHRTEEDAIKKAEEMRIRKIASLKKNLKKLEEMKFTPEKS